jgi:hypothetical protein
MPSRKNGPKIRICARKKLVADPGRMNRRVGVARRKGHIFGNNHTRNSVTRGALSGRRIQGEPEGTIGVTDEYTRRRLHPGNQRTDSRTFRKTLGLGIRQQAVEISS